MITDCPKEAVLRAESMARLSGKSYAVCNASHGQLRVLLENRALTNGNRILETCHPPSYSLGRSSHPGR